MGELFGLNGHDKLSATAYKELELIFLRPSFGLDFDFYNEKLTSNVSGLSVKIQLFLLKKLRRGNHQFSQAN